MFSALRQPALRAEVSLRLFRPSDPDLIESDGLLQP